MNSEKWPLSASGQISEYLEKCIANEKVGGSYIFCGPDNLGKTTVAKYFSKLLLCKERIKNADNLKPCGICSACRQLSQEELVGEQVDISQMHGDFHIIKREKDKKNISIEQVREFIRILSLSSFDGGFKIGIIKHADALSTEAANALLKTLEEPNNKIVIVLISQDPDMLPATIASRSQIISFKPLSADRIYDFLLKEHSVGREKARNISRLCLGRPALALKFIEDNEFYEFYNKRAEALLDMHNTDINGRFAIIDDILDKKLKGQEAVRVAQRVIEIWQGVSRDWLLLLMGHNKLIQHIYLEEKIRKTSYSHDIKNLTKLIATLSKSHTFLKANVSPRLVFEKIAINI